jgi:hypothetical protein
MWWTKPQTNPHMLSVKPLDHMQATNLLGLLNLHTNSWFLLVPIQHLAMLNQSSISIQKCLSQKLVARHTGLSGVSWMCKHQGVNQLSYLRLPLRRSLCCAFFSPARSKQRLVFFLGHLTNFIIYLNVWSCH